MCLVSRTTRLKGTLRLIGRLDGNGIKGRTAVRSVPLAVIGPLNAWLELIAIDRRALWRPRLCAAKT